MINNPQISPRWRLGSSVSDESSPTLHSHRSGQKTRTNEGTHSAPPIHDSSRQAKGLLHWTTERCFRSEDSTVSYAHLEKVRRVITRCLSGKEFASFTKLFSPYSRSFQHHFPVLPSRMFLPLIRLPTVRAPWSTVLDLTQVLTFAWGFA